MPASLSRSDGRGSGATLPELGPGELIRYSRHLVLPGLGVEGQRRLKSARVLVVGAGGLGSPAALYLVAAGVGVVGIVDGDVVEVSNLQRQVLHGTRAVGRPKVESARDRLTDLNPDVAVVVHHDRLTSANALGLLDQYDLIVDGSDNFPTRYLVNDACVLLGRPYVYGAIFRFDGQASVFCTPDGPCYRCLFREPPPPHLVPSCAEGGVLGAVPGVIGSVQALEALKLLTGNGEPLIGRLLLLDGLKMQTREIAVERDRDCPVCGEHPTITRLIDYEAFCGLGEGGHVTESALELSAQELRQELERNPDLLLLDVREPFEHRIAHIAGAKLIPLGELPGRIGELTGRAEIVAYCHRGVRSLEAVRLLQAAGFPRPRSLRGGIDAWAQEVDKTIARY